MDIIKRKVEKVVKNQGDTSLAHLEATLELSDKIDELKEAIQSIPETVIPEPKELPEYPTKMEMSLTGVSVVTLKGDVGEKGEKGEKGDTGEKGKDGENGINGRDGVDGRDGLDGINGENGKDGSPDTAEQVRDKLETLEGDERLKRSAIQGGEKLVDQENLDRAISILDQRTQYLINKPVSSQNTTSSASLIVGTTPVNNGTDTRVLYDNAGVLGEYVASSSATVSSVTMRDADANIFANNYISNATSTVSAGGTTVLTAASSRLQILTGSSNENYQLPDATTLAISAWFTFNNNSSGSLVVKNAGSTTLYTVPAGGAVDCFVTNIGSANGVWDFHALAPSITTWSSGASGLVMNTVLSTSPQILSGASSATVPSFIPQRGASTTGFGGDGTNLHAIIGGSTSTTFNSTGLSVGTSGVITTGTVELGHASDTTLARVSAGVASIEGATIATLPAAQTFTGQNKFNNFIDVNNAITASGNAATVPVTYRLSTVTNNSAATLTITMTTTSAVDGQMTVVRILDASAVAQTITWVNTENSTVTAPTTSNGSTTLPLTVGFQYNGATSKWRCIAKA